MRRNHVQLFISVLCVLVSLLRCVGCGHIVLRHIGCNCVLLRQLFSLLLVHSLVWLPKVHLAVLFVLKCLHHCEVCDYISFGVTRSLEWMMLNGLKLQTQDAVTVDAGLNVGKSEPGNAVSYTHLTLPTIYSV